MVRFRWRGVAGALAFGMTLWMFLVYIVGYSSVIAGAIAVPATVFALAVCSIHREENP